MPALAIVAGGSLLAGAYGAHEQKSAAKDAAETQAEAAQLGVSSQERQTQLAIDEQKRQFDALQKVLAPYVNAGTGAIGSYQNLLGLGGAGQQQQAIAQLQQSPQFSQMIQQGENAILQNASATGGLRGGNTQAALAQFRPQLLNQLIQQQLGNYGGLAQLGQASAAGQASAGMQTGANIGNLYSQLGVGQANAAQQVGAAQAGRAIAAGKANASILPNALGYLGLGKGLGLF
jgi:hypothetical protein